MDSKLDTKPALPKGFVAAEPCGGTGFTFTQCLKAFISLPIPICSLCIKDRYIAHKVHVFVAQDLEWDPLELEDGEELFVQTLPLDEALAETRRDYRVDPEAALALWLYAGNSHTTKSHHE